MKKITISILITLFLLAGFQTALARNILDNFNPQQPFLLGAVVTPKFPGTLNNFSEGDIIEEEDWNALEAAIGTTTSTVTSSISYQLRNANSSNPGHTHTSSSVSGFEYSLTFSTGLNRSGNTITNIGVQQLQGSTYLGVSSATGTVTLTNLGVQSLIAGSNITISSATGTITIASTGGGVSTSSPFTVGYIPFATSPSAITNSNIFQSGSNIGIGTTTPSEKLHIFGNIGLTSGYSILFNREISNTDTFINSPLIQTLVLGVNNTNAIIIASSTKVGIGMIGATFPAYKLDINGDLRVNTSSTLGNVISGNWLGSAIGDSYISSASNWNSKATSTITITGAGALQGGGDLTANRTITSAMVFTGSTYLGIASSSPTWTFTNLGVQTLTGTSPISVSTATGTPTISITNPTVRGQLLMASGTTQWVVGNLIAGSNITITTSTPGQITFAASGGGTPGGNTTQIQFNNGGAFLGDSNLTWSSSTQLLTITGTSTVAKLTVSGSGTPFQVTAGTSALQGITWTNATGTTFTSTGAGTGLTVTNNASIAGVTYSGTNITPASGFTIGATTQTLTLQGSSTAIIATSTNPITFTTGGAERMRIASSGYVGIGTTTPNNLLSVYDLIDFNSTDYNTKLGYQAGKNIVSGAVSNTFIGYQAGFSSSTGSTNVADYNTGVGWHSLYTNATGTYNTAIGYASLLFNTTGHRNVANGTYSLYNNTTGYHNTASGNYSLEENTTGYDNTAIGHYSLYSNITGSGNVGLGSFAGKYELGSNTFYVDNQDRTNTAGDKANALLYGTFATAPANQTLTINASTTVSSTLIVTTQVSSTNAFFGNATGTYIGATSVSSTKMWGNEVCSTPFTINYPTTTQGVYPDANPGDVIYLFNNTSTITKINAWNQAVADTATVSYTYNTNPSSATSTFLVAGNQTITATTTITTITSFTSSTPMKNALLRVSFQGTASSTSFGTNVCFREQPF